MELLKSTTVVANWTVF